MIDFGYECAECDAIDTGTPIDTECSACHAIGSLWPVVISPCPQGPGLVTGSDIDRCDSQWHHWGIGKHVGPYDMPMVGRSPT